MANTKSKLLNPDTAPKATSIWKGFDRAAFQRRTQTLQQHVAGRRTYAGSSTSKDDESYPIPFEVEKSIADDLAFIAACEPRVDFVTAVAIEQDQSQRSLVVQLAVNEGVCPEVKSIFDEVFGMLRQCARKDIAQEECRQQLLHSIVHLNRNRILGRLGSAWFKRPRHLSKVREQLPARLRQLFRKYMEPRRSHLNSQDIAVLDGQISSFEAAFDRLEDGQATDVVLNLEFAVMQAFELTGDGVKLPDRLRALGCPPSVLDARDVKEVCKVANYWRVSRHLAICSHRFRACFSYAEWQPLASYGASTIPSTLSERYVHAEIQLLVHYELHPRQLMPRAIGGSKEACFLCDSFIRAHDRFAIAGAHRQMYPKWTVPDLKDYTPQTVDHFRRVLSQVQLAVKGEYSKAKKQRTSGPFPLQSAINLNAIHLPTPSASTTSMRRASGSSEGARTIRSIDTSKGLQPKQAKQCAYIAERKDAEGCEEAKTAVSSRVEQHDVDEGREGIVEEVPVDIAVNEAVSGHTDWLHVLASFSRVSVDNASSLQQQRTLGGSISLAPDLGNEPRRTYKLADIPFDQELVLERDPHDGPDELSFLLSGKQDQIVRIHCRWHTA